MWDKVCNTSTENGYQRKKGFQFSATTKWCLRGFFPLLFYHPLAQSLLFFEKKQSVNTGTQLSSRTRDKKNKFIFFNTLPPSPICNVSLKKKDQSKSIKVDSTPQYMPAKASFRSICLLF